MSDIPAPKEPSKPVIDDEQIKALLSRPASEGGMGAQFEQFPEDLPETPQDYNIDKLTEPMDREDVGKFIKGLEMYISAPQIKDEFVGKSHADREETRGRVIGSLRETYGHETAERANEILGLNKFKRNMLNDVENVASLYGAFVEPNLGPSEGGKKIREIFREKVKVTEDVDPWSEDVPIENKQAVVREMTEACSQMLWDIHNNLNK